jgi:hypothetical protein
VEHDLQQLKNKWSLTKSEAAALLSVDEGSIDYLHRTRQLRGIKISGNLRWRPDDVKRYIESLKPDGEQ